MTERTCGGIPREKIQWYPTILTNKCTKCGACVSFCKQAVYTDGEDGSMVKNPFNCVVGCTGCASECPSQAIIFPSLVDLRDALTLLRKECGLLRGGDL
ncbi:MAG: 4Fe-4S binding protein [Thermoplasmata archaeon]|nr:4Fe-4S binding protein [Thermoplasmata archaeon]MCJ7561391.1 4Fe-4S binding protein [Thermoplasmata archaeon]